MRKRPFFLTLLSGLALVLTSSSCSSTSTTKTGIEPGSPAFFWAAAKDAHSKGDFALAAENLRRLTTGPANEYRERAEVWVMTLYAGLAAGDMEWVQTLKDGLKTARSNQADFRKAMTAASADANQNLMQYAEVAHAAMNRGLPSPDVPVAFTIPALDAKDTDAEPGKIAKGILPPAAELAAIRQQYRRKAAFLAMTRVSGNGKDIEKAKAALAGGDLKIKTDAWRTAIAQDFLTAADCYEPKRLDHAARAKLMLDEAKEALEKIPAGGEAKDLKKRLDTLSKKLLKPATS